MHREVFIFSEFKNILFRLTGNSLTVNPARILAPMPKLTITTRDQADYNVELTEAQMERYSIARREGRLHITTDEKRGLFVIAEQMKPGKFDTSQLAKGSEIIDQGKVIAMGKMSPAKIEVTH
jgi:hypothetical protein